MLDVALAGHPASQRAPRIKAVEQVLHACTALLALATLLWFIHGLDRGLELTDESYYLLSAIHADQIQLFFSPTHWVSGWLWQISQSLTSFRALGLALAVASSGVLAWGALRLAIAAELVVQPVSRSSQLALFASSTSAALLYGSLLNFTPSYNLLAASGSCFSAGLGMLAIGAKEGSRQVWFLATACGVALGITVLCKFSSGISTAALLMGMQLMWGWRQPWRLWPMLYMLACAAAIVLLAMLLQTGFAEAVRQFQEGIALVWFAQGDHSTSNRLFRSAADMARMLNAAGYAFWGPLACFALAAFWRHFWVAGLGFAWFTVLLVLDNHLVAGVGRHALQVVPWVALLAGLMLMTARRWLRSMRSAVLVLALLILPIGIAIGTWNPLQIQILAGLAPWGVLFGLLLVAFSGLPEPRIRLVGALCAVLFGMGVLVQCLSSAERPYRIPARALQTEKLTVGAMGVVKIDKNTAALVRAMQEAGQRCGIAPGRPFVDLYNLPAVGLMLNAVPVVSPWLLNAGYADTVLRQADPTLLRQAIVVVKSEANANSPFRPPVQLAGFPGGYRMCGEGISPMDGVPVALWAPD